MSFSFPADLQNKHAMPMQNLSHVSQMTNVQNHIVQKKIVYEHISKNNFIPQEARALLDSRQCGWLLKATKVTECVARQFVHTSSHWNDCKASY